MDQAAFEILGIKNLPKSKKRSDVSIIQLVQEGLSKKHLLKVKGITGLSFSTLASILSISTKTIESYNLDDKFSGTASERLLKLAEVIVLGKKVFGNEELFNTWLSSPLRPLEGQRPVDIMVNFYGLELIRNLLGRIEHGVYS